jgi:site-specific recombinase XerD
MEKFAMLDEMLQSIDCFLDESNYAESTIVSYGYALRRFCAWLDGRGSEISAVDAGLLSKFLKSNKPMWSNNMQRLYGNAIKSFIRWSYGPDHPALRIKLPKDNAAPGRSLDSSQLEDLMVSFDTTRANGWRNLAMISIMVETGIRAIEVCRMEMRYLDIHKRKFDVLAKNQVWREGKFSENTSLYLDMWLSCRQNIAAKGCPNVFVGILGKTPGQKMTPGGLRAEFRKYGIRSCVGKLSPHDLRRTMATLLTEAGAPTRLVQKLGAWDDIRMVERYTQNLKTQDIEKYSPVVRALSIKLCR